MTTLTVLMRPATAKYALVIFGHRAFARSLTAEASSFTLA